MKKLIYFSACLFSFILLVSFTDSNKKLERKLKKSIRVEKINDGLFLDKREVTFIDWMEYMQWNLENKGITSPGFFSTIPDTSVINKFLFKDGKAVKICIFKENKFSVSHPAYNTFPIVGISFEQALSYCQWRSERLQEKFNTKIICRLPTQEEFKIYREYYMVGFKEIEGRKTISENKHGIYKSPTVQEMASEKGIAFGERSQDWSTSEQVKSDYQKTEAWIGFRCMLEVQE